jgi:hypothetical protein
MLLEANCCSLKTIKTPLKMLTLHFRLVQCFDPTGSSSGDTLLEGVFTALLSWILHTSIRVCGFIVLLGRTTPTLGFPVSTRRLLAMDLKTGIIQVSQNHTLPIPLPNNTHKVSTSHLKPLQLDKILLFDDDTSIHL